jgi:hypothetical protein
MRTARHFAGPLRPAARAIFACLGAITLCGCIHIAPVPFQGEQKEAMELAKQLKNLMPEADELLHDEQLTANDLRVMTDEIGSRDFKEYRDKFDSAIEALITIKNRRAQIEERIRQGVWRGELANLVRNSAVDELEESQFQTISWIQLAHNFRERTQYGRTKDFPEMAELNRSLDMFLEELPDQPLAFEFGALRSEYGFRESDLGP